VTIGGGLNLHGIVRGAITTVNEDVTVAYERSNGFAIGQSGKPTPQYLPVEPIRAQFQALTYKDLAQLDGINQNGVRRGVYLYGSADGVVRADAKGGDLITDSENHVWLVTQNLEQWPFWCKVAVTLQNGS
jgi:hypothetical protein